MKDLILYFLRLGATGFGGPLALIAYMERDLVERRGWFSRQEYLRGLALSQMMPGPVAAQLAVYLGYVKGGAKGAALTGLAFTAVPFLLVVLLGALYRQYGGLAWLTSVLYSVGAAVIAIIARSAWRLIRATVTKPFLWGIFGTVFFTTVLTGQASFWLFPAAGLAAVWALAGPIKPGKAGSAMLAAFPGLSHFYWPVSGSMLGQMFWAFAKAGALVYGSGWVIVPYLYSGVVEHHRWLTEREFLDAVAVGSLTPGPFTIAAAFMGFLAAGLPGALAGAGGMYLPIYFFVVVPAKFFERFAESPALKAFVEGVTSAAAGALAASAVFLAARNIADWRSGLLAAGAFALLIRFKNAEPLVVLAAAVLGLFF